MARNIFISVLGAGHYEECIYFKDEFSKPTKYIQEACLQYLTNKEKKETVGLDKAFFLLTEKASQVHWPQLKDILCADGFSSVLEEVHIRDGKNECEVWDIFTKIYDIMEDGDNIYFDVTHAFRYLPMLVVAVGYYSVFLKNTNIKAVFYGNYDGRNLETNEAPIMDFLPIVQIQHWSYAAGSYLKEGSVSSLVSLCRETLLPKKLDALRQGLGVDDEKLLERFSNLLEQFVNERRSCRGRDVLSSGSVAQLKKALDKLKKNLLPAYEPIIGKIGEDLSSFNPVRDFNNLYASAQWCFDVGLYPQAITFIQEGLVTKFCVENCLDDVADRKLVSDAINYKALLKRAERKGSSKSGSTLKFDQSAVELSEKVDSKFAFFCLYASRVRNDINHCGFRGEEGDPNKPIPTNQIKKKVGKVLADAKEYFLESLDFGNDTSPRESSFLNISNHPIAKWSDEQLNAAMEYADFKEENMIEMGFPQIYPDWDEEKITDLALEWLGKVKASAPYPFNTTVHVMGEMNFTHCLVKELMSCGYLCVASTTKRNVVEIESGEKVSKFEFVRFREYY